MAASLSTALKEQLSCSVCLEVYTQPKTLKCLHTFCLPCLQELADKTPPQIPLRCPDCKADIILPPGASVDTLPNAFYFKRLLELLAIQEPEQTTASCGGCTRNKPLTSFCFDCGQFLCSLCTDLVEHNLHHYLPIRKAADQCKAAIIQAGTKAKAKCAIIEVAIAKAEESYGRTASQIQTASREIQERVEHFIQLLRHHEKTVLSELDEIKQGETRRYKAQRSKLEMQLVQLKSAVEFVDTAVERNSSREIIETHNTVIQRCKELVSDDEQVHGQTSKVQVKYEAFKEFTPGRVLVTGLVDPSRSTVEGQGIRAATVGKQTSFAVITRNCQGQVCSSEGGCVEVTIKSSSGEAVEPTVLDQKNGHCTVRYTPTNVGSCEVAVQILGRAVAGSPFEVRVRQAEFKPLGAFASKGSGAGQLILPWGIAVNSKGEVAVTDSNSHRIQLFTGDGQHLRTIGSRGSGEGQFNLPRGIAFDQQDRIIVADCDNHRIQILTTSGQYLKTFGEDQLKSLRGVCVTTEGNIAVCSKGEKRGVKVFTQDGVLIQRFDDSQRKCPPFDITSSEEKVFVSYVEDHVVSVFSREGTLLYSFGGRGQLDGQFDWPWGVAVDQSGRVFVCDSGNHRIQVFTTRGQFLGKIGKQGTALGQFYDPSSITISSSGQLYVSECRGHRVQLLSFE